MKGRAAQEVGSFLSLEVSKLWLTEHLQGLVAIRCICTDYLSSLEPLQPSKISHLFTDKLKLTSSRKC